MLFFYTYNEHSTGSRALVNSLTFPFDGTQLESYYKKLVIKKYVMIVFNFYQNDLDLM